MTGTRQSPAIRQRQPSAGCDCRSGTPRGRKSGLRGSSQNASRSVPSQARSRSGPRAAADALSRRQPKTRPRGPASRAARAHPGSGPGPAPDPDQGAGRAGRNERNGNHAGRGIASREGDLTMPEQSIDVAFWGRVSTEDNQDPESSRGWQLTRAKALVEPHGGRIVAEFFDIDKSRSIPPQRRPEASRLLAGTGRPAPRLRRRGRGGAAAGVLRQPVRQHVPDLRPLRRAAVGARSRRPDRPGERGPRPDHVRVRRRLQRRAEPDQDPGPDRDGRPGPARRPVPRRPAAVRLQARSTRARTPTRPRPPTASACTRSPDRRDRRAPSWSGSSPSSSPGTASTPSPSS